MELLRAIGYARFVFLEGVVLVQCLSLWSGFLIDFQERWILGRFLINFIRRCKVNCIHRKFRRILSIRRGVASFHIEIWRGTRCCFAIRGNLRGVGLLVRFLKLGITVIAAVLKNRHELLCLLFHHWFVQFTIRTVFNLFHGGFISLTLLNLLELGTNLFVWLCKNGAYGRIEVWRVEMLNLFRHLFGHSILYLLIYENNNLLDYHLKSSTNFWIAIVFHIIK